MKAKDKMLKSNFREDEMTKTKKSLSFFLLLFLFLILSFSSVQAKSYNLYMDVSKPNNFSGENIYFANVTFQDWTKISTKAFGLTGTLYNTSRSPLTISYTISFLDSSYNEITSQEEKLTVNPGTNNFNQMYNDSVLNGYEASDISYYQFYISEIKPAKENINVTPSKSSLYKNYDYVLDKYDVDIVVNENNTFDITESITAYFNVAKHGLIRTIPLKNTVTRLDGTTSQNKARITKVYVDNPYTTSKENNTYQIKIGSSESTLKGEKDYVIKYSYNLGKDPNTNYDELYFNIIGNEWDTVIGNITFHITMPKEFDASKLGFSSGSYGSLDNDNVKYEVKGNEITGQYNGVLSAREALTVRLELPEGYFVNAGIQVGLGYSLVIIIPLLFLGIAIFLWYKFGRDDDVIETVEFYPPEGLNSLEVGFLYKGEASNKDVTSLLIYLANKGYIKISEIDKKSFLSSKKSFKITKVKNYDGQNELERKFLKGLFKKKQTITSLFAKTPSDDEENITEVTERDLYDNFYKTLQDILSSINSYKNKTQIYEKSASNKAWIILLMIIGTYCIITIPPLIIAGESEMIILVLVFTGIGFSIAIWMLTGTGNFFIKIFGLLWGFLFGGLPWLFVFLPILMENIIFMVSYLIGIICIAGMIICLKYLPKRTPYGNAMLGKLRGFKNFLETAEKDKLEAMVFENPTYFYDILPYTYVLGVSDKWIKKFETIAMVAPSWYDSPSAFDMNSFSSFMDHTMTSAQTAMTSSPSSSSGGSSGGGSSGGGSGGGGGSSW